MQPSLNRLEPRLGRHDQALAAAALGNREGDVVAGAVARAVHREVPQGSARRFRAPGRCPPRCARPAARSARAGPRRWRARAAGGRACASSTENQRRASGPLEPHALRARGLPGRCADAAGSQPPVHRLERGRGRWRGCGLRAEARGGRRRRRGRCGAAAGAGAAARCAQRWCRCCRGLVRGRVPRLDVDVGRGGGAGLVCATGRCVAAAARLSCAIGTRRRRLRRRVPGLRPLTGRRACAGALAWPASASRVRAVSLAWSPAGARCPACGARWLSVARWPLPAAVASQAAGLRSRAVCRWRRDVRGTTALRPVGRAAAAVAASRAPQAALRTAAAGNQTAPRRHLCPGSARESRGRVGRGVRHCRRDDGGRPAQPARGMGGRTGRPLARLWFRGLPAHAARGAVAK